MGRKIIVDLTQERENIDLSINKQFRLNFQNAILLSLLEQKKISKWQYDKCEEELRRLIL